MHCTLFHTALKCVKSFEMFSTPILLISILFHLLNQYNCQLAAKNNLTLDSKQQASVVESLFGQIAKSVVYGGATFARFNNKILCPLLKQPSEPKNDDQPILFTFNNYKLPQRAFRIYADDEITPWMIEVAQFERSQMTYIFVHGWLGGIHNELWLSEAKNAILKLTSDNEQLASNGTSHFKPNVIIVEWSDFALGSLYTATENSFKVSRRLGYLLEQLVSVGGLKAELMHCLGHSIGSHICGQAARIAFPAPTSRSKKSLASPRMGRITGLDPGGFCYELGIRNETTYLGLKPSDALVVDAYNSNRTPFGNKYLVGQYNVRINNGFFQEPCSVWLNPMVAKEYFKAAVRFTMGTIGNNDILTCDHYFATRFTRSLPSSRQYSNLSLTCSYVAYSCDSYRNFLRGKCGLCDSPAQCYSMDFEYQRGDNSSNEHALEHLRKHSSSYLHEFEDQDGQPIGSVKYENRRAYYLHITNEEPYCTFIYRIRVFLNSEAVDLGSFRNSWLELRFSSQNKSIVRVRDTVSGKMTETVGLFGPWIGLNSEERYSLGLEENTLTAMVELVEGEPIEEVQVVYNNRLHRRQDPLANPINLIQVDFLSSAERNIRASHSRSFSRGQFKITYKHLEDTFVVAESN